MTRARPASRISGRRTARPISTPTESAPHSAIIQPQGIAAGSQEAWLYSVWGKILEDNKNYDAAITKFSKAVAMRDEPWSGYARKQIARQAQLKKRAKLIAAQGGMK